METVSGVSNWKLVIRREERSVRILRGVTCDERAVLPEELFGLPVTELGGHALSPTAPPERRGRRCWSPAASRMKRPSGTTAA